MIKFVCFWTLAAASFLAADHHGIMEEEVQRLNDAIGGVTVLNVIAANMDWSKGAANVLMENDKALSSACLKSLNHTMHSPFMNFMNHLDASGKPGSGLLVGNLQWLGNYEECMDIDGAHYCLMQNLKLSNTLPVNWGVCVPADCSEQDATAFLQAAATLINKLTNKTVVSVNPGPSTCYAKATTYSVGAAVMTVLSGSILACCLVGTVADVMLAWIKKKQRSAAHGSSEEETKPLLGLERETNSRETGKQVSFRAPRVAKQGNLVTDFLLCFSLVRNVKAIFDTSVPDGAISSINGMRTISMTWVILGHCYLFLPFMSPQDNLLAMIPVTQRFTFQAILNAEPSVDTFFVLSGLLVGYLSLKRFYQAGNLPLVRYYVHRYIRLTASYAFLLFFLMYIFPVMGDGPYWFQNGPHGPNSEFCYKYWWTNLLYINNFYPTEKGIGCMNWTWYLANDMQFYVVSPVILYVMHRYGKLGTIAVNGLLMFVTLLVTAVLIGYYKLSPIFDLSTVAGLATDMGAQGGKNDFQTIVYVKPYCRLAPYLVGILLAYLFLNGYKLKGKNRHFWNLVGWVVAVGLALTVIYVPYTTINGSWTQAENVLYGTFFRFAWALAVGWVIFACHTGYGGLINSFLSWKAFIPLSRLTYGAYLVQQMVIYFFFGGSHIPTHYSDQILVLYFLGVTMVSYMCAFIVAVCIEWPVFNLEKLLLSF